MTHLIRAAIALVALALTVTATPAVAADGYPYIDIRAAKVKHTKDAIRISYTTRSAGNRFGTEVVLVDTNPKRRGPELQIGFGRYSEGWTTPMRRWKIDRSKAAQRKWSEDPARAGTCDRTVRIHTRYDRDFTPVRITIRKKPGCITAKRVRIKVSTATDAYTDDHVTSVPFGRVVRDQLPEGKRALTPWVKQRGPKAKPRRFVDRSDRFAWSSTPPS